MKMISYNKPFVSSTAKYHLFARALIKLRLPFSNKLDRIGRWICCRKSFVILEFSFLYVYAPTNVFTKTPLAKPKTK
jgi:hypothetical protein